MSSFIRTIRKFFVSAFVVATFVAYVLHERVVNPNEGISATAPAQVAIVTQQTPAPSQVPSTLPTPAQLVLVPTPETLPTATKQTPPTATEQPTPTDQPTATALVKGMYKDGTYTGAETDAYYGWVQVEAVIQNGQIANVQFLEYPQDRRTSVRINSRAVPALQSEALQVQSANVDMISGATLTSRAFIQSLQAALDAAKA